MPNGRSYSEILGDLQRLLTAVNANADDLQHLEGSRTAFEGLVSQAQLLSQEQAALMASKQEKTYALKIVMTEGQRLATVLRFAVRQHYGIAAEKLTEFGMQPFRGRLRKIKEPEAPPPVEVTSADPASAKPSL